MNLRLDEACVLTREGKNGEKECEPGIRWDVCLVGGKLWRKEEQCEPEIRWSVCA